MKIIQFIASRGYGGAEKVFVDLCNELILRDGFEVEVILLLNNKISSLLNNKIKIHYIKDRSRYNPFLYLQLKKIVNGNLIHTHSAKATEIIYFLSFFVDCLQIGTKHNSRKGKVFNRIKYVTAVSKDVSKTIKNTSKVIYNGIKYLPIKETVNNNCFTICSVGRLDKIKGFDILINELSLLDQDFILNIVGEGDEKEYLNSIINEKGLEKKVKLLGFKTNIPQILADSDLIIMSSHSEGFSILMIESIFYGKVFISTNVSGCNEILTDKLLIDGFNIAKKVNEVMINYSNYIDEFNKVKVNQKDALQLINITKKYIKYYDWVIKNKKNTNKI